MVTRGVKTTPLPSGSDLGEFRRDRECSRRRGGNPERNFQRTGRQQSPRFQRFDSQPSSLVLREIGGHGRTSFERSSKHHSTASKHAPAAVNAPRLRVATAFLTTRKRSDTCLFQSHEYGARDERGCPRIDSTRSITLPSSLNTRQVQKFLFFIRVHQCSSVANFAFHSWPTSALLSHPWLISPPSAAGFLLEIGGT